jgi:hypothetical protein
MNEVRFDVTTNKCILLNNKSKILPEIIVQLFCQDLHFPCVLEVSVQETNQILHQTDERAVIIRILGTWIEALIKVH